MRQERGFTLIELVVAIVLLAILAFSAASRYSGSTITLAGQLEQLASDIRYTQSLSMTRGERHCIFLDTAAGQYQLRRKNVNCTAADAIPHPATGNANFINLTNVALAAANISGNYIEFDGLGKPYTFTGPNGVITLTASGESRTINVSPETGRVVVP